MGGMIAAVILALLMVPVFFVSVQRVLAGDREKLAEQAQAYRLPAQPSPPELTRTLEFAAEQPSDGGLPT
jgi:hypothetical protein